MPGWRKIALYEGSSGIDIDVDLPGGYRMYRLVGRIESDQVTEIFGRVTTDGFATVESGASDYSFVFTRVYANSATTGASSRAGDEDLSAMWIYRDIGSGPNDAATGELLRIYRPHDTSLWTTLQTNGVNYRTASSSPFRAWGSAWYAQTTDINGVRLYATSGIANLTWRLHLLGMEA